MIGRGPDGREARDVGDRGGREKPARALNACALEVKSGPDTGATAAVRTLRFRAGALQGNDLQLKDLLRPPLRAAARAARLPHSRHGQPQRHLLGGVPVLEAFLRFPTLTSVGRTGLPRHRRGLELPTSSADRFGRCQVERADARAVRASARGSRRATRPVLVTGETGTGKELVAARCTRRSRRSGGRWSSSTVERSHAVARRERAVRPREGRVHRRGPERKPGCSSAPTAARCSSTRLASCRWSSSRKPAARARARRGPARRRQGAGRRSTCASSPRPIASSRSPR